MAFKSLRCAVVDQSPEARDARRFLLFDQLLARFAPGRCYDLGSGHGKFAQRAAATGWTVTAIDARNERFVSAPGVEFVQADVRNVRLDDADLVLCLGLFYHLTLDDQIDLLGRASGAPLILDTHVASGTHDNPEVLSEPVPVGDHEGVWYVEGPREDALASWDNAQSFWHTEPSLLALLESAGYAVVLSGTPWVTPDRRFYLALP